MPVSSVFSYIRAMRHLFCLLSISLSVSLAACADSSSTAEPTDSSVSGTSGGDVAAGVCEPGRDQTCNDDPAISSLHGTCMPDRTCVCMADVEKNPATGRCL